MIDVHDDLLHTKMETGVGYFERNTSKRHIVLFEDHFLRMFDIVGIPGLVFSLRRVCACNLLDGIVPCACQGDVTNETTTTGGNQTEGRVQTHHSVVGLDCRGP